MTITPLRAVLAVTLGTAASSAAAFVPDADPNSYPLVLSGYYEIVLSGSVTPTDIVRNWIIDKACDTTHAIDVFRNYSAGVYGNDWAVGCTIRAHQDVDGDGVDDGAGEIVVAKQVLFRKRDRGASGWGTVPVTHPMNVALGTAATNGVDAVSPGGVATGYKVDIMSVSTGAGLNCDTTANPTVTLATAAGRSYDEYKCGGAVVQRVPDAGISELEPNKFFGINTPSGIPAYAKSTAVSTQTFGALVYGIPVSLDLRNALQAVQFPAANICHPANVAYAANAETEACMPNLTSTEIRSLFTGGMQTWDSFRVTNPAEPAGAKIALYNHPEVIALGGVPADKKVALCRLYRSTTGSAVFTAVFTNWPCSVAVTTPLQAPSSAFAPVIAENSSPADVGLCLDDFNDGSNNSFKNASLVKRWAIGMSSTVNNADNAQSYRFLKINGAPPSIQAVSAGAYDFYGERTMQFRTNTATLLNAALAAERTDTLIVLKHLANRAYTPADAASANTSSEYTWGQGGWLVAPRGGVGFSPDDTFSLSNPVSHVTRAPSGRIPNMCHFSTLTK